MTLTTVQSTLAKAAFAGGETVLEELWAEVPDYDVVSRLADILGYEVSQIVSGATTQPVLGAEAFYEALLEGILGYAVDLHPEVLDTLGEAGVVDLQGGRTMYHRTAEDLDEYLKGLSTSG